MPSEKSRYLGNDLGPAAPLGIDELRARLSSLDSSRLADLLWHRSQSDDVLLKASMVFAILQPASDDWETACAAIDYAIHFPDHVRYTERGHGLILDVIRQALDLMKEGQREFALRVAGYAIERAHEVAENFEDDWDWTSSLNDLEKWACGTRGEV